MTHAHEYRRDYRGHMVCYCGDELELIQPEGARDARDESLAQVDANAEADFKTLAYNVVHETAINNHTFIVDLPRAIFLKTYPSTTPHEPRAWGPVMLKAARDGLIAPTEHFRNGTQKASHMNPRRVWRSLVYASGREQKEYSNDTP